MSFVIQTRINELIEERLKKQRKNEVVIIVNLVNIIGTQCTESYIVVK